MTTADTMTTASIARKEAAASARSETLAARARYLYLTDKLADWEEGLGPELTAAEDAELVNLVKESTADDFESMEDPAVEKAFYAGFAREQARSFYSSRQ